MTIACYVRVSSRRQKDDSQRAEIQKWLEANGIDQNHVEWYADRESGRTTRRPDFDRLQADIFSGKVKTIILWKLDRLSRRLVDGVRILSDWADRGLKIVVVTQQLEFNGAVGRLVAALLMGCLRSNGNTARNDSQPVSRLRRRKASTRAANREPRRRGH